MCPVWPAGADGGRGRPPAWRWRRDSVTSVSPSVVSQWSRARAWTAALRLAGITTGLPLASTSSRTYGCASFPAVAHGQSRRVCGPSAGSVAGSWGAGHTAVLHVNTGDCYAPSRRHLARGLGRPQWKHVANLAPGVSMGTWSSPAFSPCPLQGQQ